MDRRDFYYKQRVTEAEMDAAFDDAENSIWNLVNDIGLFGVVYSAEVIQHSPTNLTVDVLGPAASYDQAGQRIYWGVTQNVDCEEDYQGNPTVPSTSGQKVWISLHARFDRNLQDQRTDGNGSPVYWIRAESFEIRVVAGTPAGGGGHTKPAKPTDAVLLADIELEYNQTAIVTANIDTSRRDDFAWTTGSNISVDDSAWANLGPAADVQSAFDSVDDVVLDRDGTGDITEDIIPAAAGQFLGESGTAWDAYLRNVTLSGPIVLASDGLDIGDASNRADIHILTGICYSLFRPDITGRSLGDATRRWDAYMEDVTVYGSLLANATGQAFGGAGARWDAYLEDVTVYGGLLPSATGGALGGSGARWDAYLEAVVCYSDSIAFDAWITGLSVVVGANEAQSADWALTTPDQWEVTSTSSELELLYPVSERVPNGARITGFAIKWYQATDQANDMYCQLEKRAFNGSPSTIGTALTIDSFGSNTTDAKTGLTEVVDATSYYALRVFTTDTAAVTCRSFEIRIDYDVLYIGRSIKGSGT